MFVFTFYTQVETWCSNIKRLVKFKVVKVVEFILCPKLSIEKENTKVVLFVSLRLCYTENTKT